MNVNVVEEIGQVVTKVNDKLNESDDWDYTVHYMYGHHIEINSRLQEMTQSPVKKNERFPLVILFTDISVEKNQPIGYYGNARLNMVVANITDPNYIASDRLENNFKPILQPIKNELINQIKRHKQFSFEGLVEYTEIERFFWGKTGLYGNTANEFNDYLDCIEIKNLKVNIKNKC